MAWQTNFSSGRLASDDRAHAFAMEDGSRRLLAAIQAARAAAPRVPVTQERIS